MEIQEHSVDPVRSAYKDELEHMFYSFCGYMSICNGKKINISGSKDVWMDKPDYTPIRKKIEKDDYHIHLLHNPNYIKEIQNEKIDLALAGHFHAGQLNLLPKLSLARMASKYVHIQ